ncbi:MAG: hypothetical protein LH615_11425 [Ferruginibacter sp.]|nr:hypothetical protein [Ferruginibacter sp.]
MKNNLVCLAPGICIFLLSSCFSTTPKYLFAPNSTNLLELKNKGDLKAAVNYSSTSHPNRILEENSSGRQRSNGVDLQTAFAISNNIAVKLDGFTKRETDRSINTVNNPYRYFLKYKRSGAEISVGYYKFFGDNKQVALNIFAGVGAGKTSFTGTYRLDSINNYFYNASHTKLFLVPSVRFNFTENYSLCLGYKITSVDFYNINTNDVGLTKGLYKSFADEKSVYGDFVIENEFGFKKIQGFKFHIQFGVSKLFTYFDYIDDVGASVINEQYQYNNRFASIGLVADLKSLFKKK